MSDPTSGSVFEESQVTPGQEQQKAPEGQQQEEVIQTPPASPAPSASSDTLFADQLASITNERGEPKYKDLPTALDALKHSQEYIPSLRQENETLKEKVERLEREAQERKDLEETIERLSAQQQQPEAPQGQQGVTEEQLKDLLEQQLSQREQAQRAQQNSQKVEEAIKQKYGEKARDIVAAKAQEYGMTSIELGQLAARSPEAALALFDVKPSPQGKTSYTTSSANIPPVNPNKGPVLERPEKSLLSGASTKEQIDYFRKVREATYQRLGVTD